jgi:peptidoglycan/xylan/chitin deacetylase (PgdA/CDA1 family)
VGIKHLIIKSNARLGLLWVARTLGGFALSRWLTRKALRILCYHGIWLGEAHFSNFLFMSAAKFKRRTELIKKWKFPVISLDQALRGIEDGTLRNCATVITVDDGWFGTAKVMVPEFIAQQLPATIYSTSYYAEKQLPVFDVALDYILSRSTTRSLDLRTISNELSGEYQLAQSSEREALADRLSEYASQFNGATCFELLQRLSAALEMDLQFLIDNRVFHLMSLDEIKHAADQGIDIQLHTHRHRFPVDDVTGIRQEIEDNRKSLSAVTTKPLKHFCYPSGVWNDAAFPALRQLGIASAVTTEQGLNFGGTSPLRLRRISDGEYVHELEFEAELSGFAEVMRAIKGSFRRMLTTQNNSQKN